MPTRPTPSLSDRPALTGGTADVNPFAGEGFPGDHFDIATFLRGDVAFLIEDTPQSASAAAAAFAGPLSTVIADALPATVPATPPLGVIAEGGTLPDRLVGLDGSVQVGGAATAAPIADPTLGLAGDFARGPVPASELTLAPASAGDPIADRVPVLAGGPLIVQIDPSTTEARPLNDPPSLSLAVTDPPVTASTPGFTLEWAPVLESHGAAASAHVPLFDAGLAADDPLLSALIDLPTVPPITPPNGDGLGG